MFSGLLQFLNHESSIQLLGVLFDITGAFYLSRAFVFKKSADIKSETYGDINQDTRIDFGVSGNLFFSFYKQGVEAKIGFILLLVGFILQGIGIVWPLLLRIYIIFAVYIILIVICQFIHKQLTKFERIRDIHDRDEKNDDKQIKKFTIPKLKIIFKKIFNKKSASILLRIFFVIIVPLIITQWFFSPLKTKELPQYYLTINVNPQPLTDLQSMQKNIAEEVLGIKADFIDLCVKNEGFLSLNNKLVSKQKSVLSGAGRAEMEIGVDNNTQTHITVMPSEKKCITFLRTKENFSINLSPVMGLIKPDDAILKRYFEPSKNLSEPEYKFDVNFDKVRFFLRKSPLFNLIKLLVVFIFWNSLLLLVIKLFFKYIPFGIKKV